jgi:HPt (histidine-containing phosphotransfer) domain-containing protein
MDAPTPAERALQLLFKKLHPHLEDTAHALSKGASAAELEKLHHKLLKAREQTVEALEGMAEGCEEELADHLAELADNLSPVGESFQQSLILTQLCLEEAPGDLLPFAPEGCAEASPWGRRMNEFLQKLQDPAFTAERRWAAVDPDLGEEGAEG